MVFTVPVLGVCHVAAVGLVAIGTCPALGLPETVTPSKPPTPEAGMTPVRVAVYVPALNVHVSHDGPIMVLTVPTLTGIGVQVFGDRHWFTPTGAVVLKNTSPEKGEQVIGRLVPQVMWDATS